MDSAINIISAFAVIGIFAGITFALTSWDKPKRKRYKLMGNIEVDSRLKDFLFVVASFFAFLMGELIFFDLISQKLFLFPSYVFGVVFGGFISLSLMAWRFSRDSKNLARRHSTLYPNLGRTYLTQGFGAATSEKKRIKKELKSIDEGNELSGVADQLSAAIGALAVEIRAGGNRPYDNVVTLTLRSILRLTEAQKKREDVAFDINFMKLVPWGEYDANVHGKLHFCFGRKTRYQSVLSLQNYLVAQNLVAGATIS